MKTQPRAFPSLSLKVFPSILAGVIGLLGILLLTNPLQGEPLAVSYLTGEEVPLTTDGFTAAGESVEFTLNYAPGTGTNLMVVNNTGLDFIEGSFSNLPNGAEVELVHDGTPYRFIAWYYGGDGNDLVLLWPYTNLGAWGLNLENQLGIGASGDRRVPVAVDQSGALVGRTIVQVARGTSHSVALTSEGRVYAWGRNAEGQLGDGSAQRRATPVPVNTTAGESALFDKMVVAIAAGREHCLALCSDGTVASWGINSDGRLGDGTETHARVPVAVDRSSGTSALFGKKVVGIAAGRSHSLALCSDGTLASWGGNAQGQLGDGTVSPRSSPVAVDTGSGTSALFGKSAVAIASGRYHNLAACSDGTVVAWGLNEDGQVGDNTVVQRNAPVAVNAEAGTSALFGRTVVGVAAGTFHSLALCADGTITAWGANNFGQLGDSTKIGRLAPVEVDSGGALAGKTVVSVALGLYHSLALSTDGTVAAWGSNFFGQLGDSTLTERLVPVAVSDSGASVFAGRTVGSLAASGAEGNHSLAIFGVAESEFDVEPKAEIGLEQPAGSELSEGGSRDFGVIQLGEVATLIFTIANTGEAELTGLGIAASGPDASEFSVTVAPVAPVPGSGGTTTFEVEFAPTSSGSKTVTLRIDNNDPDENPFRITLRGLALSTEEDSDNDGLSDWSEVQLGPLGFDWQVPQTAMVENLLENAGLAGLYDQAAYDANREAGRNEILNDPQAAGLYDQTEYDANRQAGRDEILDDPNAAGLYDQAQYDANREAGRNEILNDPNAVGLFTLAQCDASRLAGRAEVLADPNAFGLYDQAQYEANRQGREDVLNDPNAFGLYDQAQYEANRSAGQDDVLGDPNAYQLFTFSQVDVLTVGAPLLTRDDATGEFCLTLGVEISTDLQHYSPFPFDEGGTSLTADGKVKVRFTGPDGTAFFRVLGK